MYIFSIFYDMKVCCVFSLESPHRGDSNEYTQYIIFDIKKGKNIQNLQLWDFFKELKNEFETAVVHKPSVFEPLKVYWFLWKGLISRHTMVLQTYSVHEQKCQYICAKVNMHVLQD